MNYVPLSEYEYRATIYTRKHIKVWNIDSVFLNNVGADAGVLYVGSYVSATNLNSTFLNNNGFAGVLYGDDNVMIMNKESVFKLNKGEDGGSIYMVGGATCVNTDSIFAHNFASSNTGSSTGGAIHGRHDVEITNSRSNFINNSANYGGAIYIKTKGSCTNIDSFYVDNSAPSGGGAIYIRYYVTLINTRT